MLKSTKIGIWGLGATGISAINYLSNLGYELEVTDQTTPNAEQEAFLQVKRIQFYPQTNIESFLQRNDFILPSPGIDLRPYAAYKHKWLAELDLFQAAWHKPIVAITGSIGKTTVTHLLSAMLELSGKKVATGGNIGTPMFDLLAQQDTYDIAVLEVSSFQLELCTTFAPDLAIWTNLHPNHLDRHGTFEHYRAAKVNILLRQHNGQQALVPLTLKNELPTTQGAVHYFANTQPLDTTTSTVFYKDNTQLIARSNDTRVALVDCNQLPQITFEDNWLILCAALYLLGVKLPPAQTLVELTLPEHRLEKVATIHGVNFFNDSKSTTIESTMAAVNRLQGKPILLLLGGLSKGVDRTPLLQALQGKVKKIFCFGKEAEHLACLCQLFGIAHAISPTMDHAFLAITQEMQPDDQVLLSPAGSSYDLFKNYMERGTYFKKLVQQLH